MALVSFQKMMKLPERIYRILQMKLGLFNPNCPQLCAMAFIQVSQISFESEVCGVKWRHFYDKIVYKWDIVADMELTCGKLINRDKMKLV